MSLFLFKIFIALGSVFSFFSAILILNQFDPSQTGFFGFLLLYSSILLTVSGIVFLLIDLVKSKFLKNKLFYRIKTSFRHAILLGLLMIGWLWLESHEMVHWWNLAGLVVVLLVTEFFFMSSKKEKNFYEGETTAD